MNFRSKVVNSCEALLVSAMAGCQLGLFFVVLDVITEHKPIDNVVVQEARADEELIETVVVRG